MKNPRDKNIKRFGGFSTPEGMIAIDKFAFEYGIAKGALTEVLVTGLVARHSKVEIQDLLDYAKHIVEKNRPLDKRKLRGEALKKIFNMPLKDLEKIAKNFDKVVSDLEYSDTENKSWARP